MSTGRATAANTGCLARNAGPARADAAALAPSHVPYVLQPKDVGGRLLYPSGRAGVLVGDHSHALVDAVRRDLGQAFRSFATRGDGGCGLHAAWGEPSAERDLEYPGGQSRGRAFVRSHLPVDLQDLQQHLGECAAAARLLEDVVL